MNSSSKLIYLFDAYGENLSGVKFVRLVASVLVLLIAVSCSPSVDSEIDTPYVKIPKIEDETRARLALTTVDVGDFYDRREKIDFSKGKQTQPNKQAARTVRNAFIRSLSKMGVVVSENADVQLRGEVLGWNSEVDADNGSDLSSHASIQLSVFNDKEQRIYTGTFNGSRSSSFPLVTRDDIKDSLSIAMTNAINQALVNEEFANSLRR